MTILNPDKAFNLLKKYGLLVKFINIPEGLTYCYWGAIDREDNYRIKGPNQTGLLRNSNMTLVASDHTTESEYVMSSDITAALNLFRAEGLMETTKIDSFKLIEATHLLVIQKNDGSIKLGSTHKSVSAAQIEAVRVKTEDPRDQVFVATIVYEAVNDIKIKEIQHEKEADPLEVT